MRRALAVAAIVCTTLAGCGGPTEGTVTAKEFRKGYIYIQLIPCGSNGQTCPIPHNVPDCYRLIIETADQESRKLCVEQDEWDAANVGDYYQEEA